MSLWATGVYDLRLSSEAFWRLTPRQFTALCERHRNDERRRDGRAALVTAMIANTVRDAKKHPKPYQPSDFLPSDGRRRGQSPEAQAVLLQAMAAAMGAVVDGGEP